jgi:hypothetical protein
MVAEQLQLFQLSSGLPTADATYVQPTDYPEQHHLLRLEPKAIASLQQIMLYSTNLTCFIAYRSSLLLSN